MTSAITHTARALLALLDGHPSGADPRLELLRELAREPAAATPSLYNTGEAWVRAHRRLRGVIGEKTSSADGARALGRAAALRVGAISFREVEAEALERLAADIKAMPGEVLKRDWVAPMIRRERAREGCCCWGEKGWRDAYRAVLELVGGCGVGAAVARDYLHGGDPWSWSEVTRLDLRGHQERLASYEEEQRALYVRDVASMQRAAVDRARVVFDEEVA